MKTLWRTAGMEELLLEGVEDSRQEWKVEHGLNEILTVVMCGVSAGEKSIRGICAFARIKEVWLRGGEPLSFGKRKCIYDDTFRKQTLFSC